MDWKMIGTVGTVIAAVAIVHGLTSPKWQEIHTIGTVLGAAAVLAPYVLARIIHGSAERS